MLEPYSNLRYTRHIPLPVRSLDPKFPHTHWNLGAHQLVSRLKTDLNYSGITFHRDFSNTCLFHYTAISILSFITVMLNDAVRIT